MIQQLNSVDQYCCLCAGQFDRQCLSLLLTPPACILVNTFWVNVFFSGDRQPVNGPVQVTGVLLHDPVATTLVQTPVLCCTVRPYTVVRVR